MSIYDTPRGWGPPFWHVMKCTAHHYPKNPTKEKKYQTRQFFTMLREFLPCDICRDHHKAYMIKYPIDDYLCCGRCLKDWIDRAEQYSKQEKKGNIDYRRIVPARKTACKYKINRNKK